MRVYSAVFCDAGSAAAGPDTAAAARDRERHQFLVFFRSQPIGREEVLVLRLADGWIVRGTSRLGPPIDITTRVAEVDYDLEWRPKSLLVDGIVRGQDVTLKTTFDGTQGVEHHRGAGRAAGEGRRGVGRPVVLPNTFLGSYAALARRLQGRRPARSCAATSRRKPKSTIRVTRSGAERIETPRGVDHRDALRADRSPTRRPPAISRSTCGPILTAPCCA